MYLHPGCGWQWVQGTGPTEPVGAQSMTSLGWHLWLQGQPWELKLLPGLSLQSRKLETEVSYDPGVPGAPHTGLARQSGSEHQRKVPMGHEEVDRQMAGQPPPREWGDPCVSSPVGGVFWVSRTGRVLLGDQTSADTCCPWEAGRRRAILLTEWSPLTSSPGHIGPSEPRKPTRWGSCVSESLQMFRAQPLIQNPCSWIFCCCCCF